MAQRPKLNHDVQEKICAVIRAGNHMETAAAYVGIHKDTLYQWMKRGARERESRQRGKPPNKREQQYLVFSNALDQAIAQGEVRNVAIIADAAQDKLGETMKPDGTMVARLIRKGEWQAAAWILERRHRERWGRYSKVELEGDLNLAALVIASMNGDDENDEDDDGASEDSS